jgi:hypothetical protein
LTVQASSGVATFTDVRFSVPGTGRVLTASVPSLTAGTSQPFDVLPAGAPQLAFRVQPGFTRVNQPFSSNLEVQVLDASGQVLVGGQRPITLSFGDNLYNAQLTGDVSVDSMSGVAVFPGVAVDRALSDSTLVARSPGAESAESAKFSVAPCGSARPAQESGPSISRSIPK